MCTELKGALSLAQDSGKGRQGGADGIWDTFLTTAPGEEKPCFAALAGF